VGDKVQDDVKKSEEAVTDHVSKKLVDHKKWLDTILKNLPSKTKSELKVLFKDVYAVADADKHHADLASKIDEEIAPLKEDISSMAKAVDILLKNGTNKPGQEKGAPVEPGSDSESGGPETGSSSGKRSLPSSSSDPYNRQALRLKQVRYNSMMVEMHQEELEEQVFILYSCTIFTMHTQTHTHTHTHSGTVCSEAEE
jgi:hypothetical protein